MGDYRKLAVWERAHRLTLAVYEVTRTLPKEELFGLTSQLRRAAASVPANIAEECGRNGDAELARFLGIAVGSATELDYHLLLARDLGYIPPARYDQLSSETQEVTRMMASFRDRLQRPTDLKPPVKKLIANS